MDARDDDRVRTQVRTAYARVAKGAAGCSVGCCGTEGGGSLVLGYTPDDLASAPDGSDLGLGCGNPQAIAALRRGKRSWTWAAGPASTASWRPAGWGAAGGSSASI